MPSTDTVWLIAAMLVLASAQGLPLWLRSDTGDIARSLKRIERLLEEKEQRDRREQRRR